MMCISFCGIDKLVFLLWMSYTCIFMYQFKKYMFPYIYIMWYILICYMIIYHIIIYHDDTFMLYWWMYGKKFNSIAYQLELCIICVKPLECLNEISVYGTDKNYDTQFETKIKHTQAFSGWQILIWSSNFYLCKYWFLYGLIFSFNSVASDEGTREAFQKCLRAL